MRLTVTLIAAGPDHRFPRLAAEICDALAISAKPVWLADEEACELPVDAPDPEAIASTVRGTIGKAPVDMLVQPAEGRRKRLLLADLEATMIENEMLDELALILGIGSEMIEITRRAMNGEIDFAEALAARTALLAGASTRVLSEAAARIRLTPGADALVGTMRRAGVRTVLVTGGFAIFADRIAAKLGFDHVVANRLEIAGATLTGKVLPPIIGGAAKRETLLGFADKLGISIDKTLAVGDGANDIAMLRTAGLGIAFRPKPAVAAAIRWRLDHADLTGLLYAQGYRKAEFAA